MWKRLTLSMLVALAFLVGTDVFAKPITLNVLSQPRREWEYLQQFLGEFKAKEGIDVKISYFAELERRSKSRLDAATKAGQFQVYYIDEANIAEFASNNWLLPIKDYYPAANDFSDFSPPLVKVLTWKGVPYGAPISFEGSMIFYRKDLFKKDGIAVPKTLDQYLEAVKHFQNPPDLYGTGTRGLRGSGMNVWRFSPYLIRFGGRWLDDEGAPVFNSPEAVKAVEYYIELIKNSPGPTMSWSDVMDNFAAGKEAIVEFANLKMDYLMDPKQSKVIGKMGFAAPAGGMSNIAVHGLAISASGCPTDDVRKAAGKFIGWWTSKENSIRRIKSGNGLTNGRISAFASKEFAAAYPAEFVQAQKDMMKMQQMCILQIPQWPEIGDYLGVKLEELFTKAYSGESYDIQAALDDAVSYAKGVLEK